MARKPKTQPSTEAAAANRAAELAALNEASAPVRRGRKPKTAAPPAELLLAASIGNPATDDVEADTHKAGPIEGSGRRGPGRKLKRSASTAITPSTQNDAAGQRGRRSRQPEAEAKPGLIEDDAPTAGAVPQAELSASSDAVQPDSDPSRSTNEAADPLPQAGTSVPMKPAARWERATDTVLFDWPALERTATQEGPNQGMAKLLIAARAEGANSRWPL